jgi:excisionase family DNA binding protein
MANRDLMTIKQMTEYLQISRRTLNNLMKKNGLPYIKLERRVLFRRSEVDKFLESKTVRKK